MTNPRRKTEGKIHPLRLQHLFLQYLRKKRVYSKWMKNVREENVREAVIAGNGWYTLMNACEFIDRSTLLECSLIRYHGFGWVNSPEGFKFWQEKLTGFVTVVRNEFEKEKYHE